MARLAIIRQQREDAAKQREAEKKCESGCLLGGVMILCILFSVKEEAAKKEKTK